MFRYLLSNVISCFCKNRDAFVSSESFFQVFFQPSNMLGILSEKTYYKSFQ